MAEVVGLLASPVLRMAGNKLGSIIAEQANMQLNFTGDLEDMRETLETLEATLEDAEKRSINEKEVQLWLKRLKNAGLDIYDMFDNFHATMTQPTGKMPGMLSRLALANKMKNMRERLRKIAKEHNRYKFTRGTSASTDQQQNDPRETTSRVIEGDIVGRDGEKQEIIDRLSASDINKGTMILPIYGLGGIGKTTLARLVFKENKFKEYNHRLWVYVSQVFDLKKIGSSIISQLPKQGSQQSTETMELINRCLDDLLRDKKVLIVLDDIWEKDNFKLKGLTDMLSVGKTGSMIDVIVTTREEVIAQKFSNEPYKLQPLKEQMCWDIIKKCSDFGSKANKEKFEEIGLNIAKKCGGVALAAQALGYTLQFKDLSGWSEVKDSDIWNESINDENASYKIVLPSLKLSFKSMPRHLRLCFAYCGIFPKGHNIVKDDLIHQWIALDLIKPSTRVGEEYIKQLSGMSFLQHSKLSSTSRKHVLCYTMHDLVHDLARSVMDDELVVFDPATKSNTSEHKCCRYALVTNYDGSSRLSTILPTRVRALHFLHSSKPELSSDAFSFAKYLRVLDFSQCSTTELPASVGQLKLLRCLIAPRMQKDRHPECITKLSKLQYLNLHGSSQISALLKSFDKLGCLIHLDLSGCSNIVDLPESFGNLESLLHLDLSGCSNIVELPESFGNLENLLHLDLSGCSAISKLPESFGKLKSSLHLGLSGCSAIEKLPESFGNLQNLLHLDLSGCSAIEILPELFGDLKDLSHLDMSGCSAIEILPESFGDLKNLSHLDLSGCSAIKELPKSIGNLKNLLRLELSGSGVDEIPEALCSLPKLEYLNLSCCCNVQKLPEGIGRLTELRYFNLSQSEKIRELPESFRELGNLVHLDLSSTRVKGVPGALSGLNKLQHLNLSRSWCYNAEKKCSDLRGLSDVLGNLTELQYLNLSASLDPILADLLPPSERGGYVQCISVPI